MAVLVAARPLLQHFFPMYLQAYPILLILVLALVARSANMGLTSIFNSRGMYSTITRIAAINLCVNLILVLFLTIKYAALGAALAALLTEGVNTAIQLWCLAHVTQAHNSPVPMGVVNSLTANRG